VSALWITLALLVAGFGGWPVTALVFRLARTIDDRSDSRAAAAGASPDSASLSSALPDAAAADPAADSTVDGEITVPPSAAAPAEGEAATAAATSDPGTRILRGGAIIGVLERLAVCLAILAGQPVAIAYVVAIKGLGRFAELKETPVAAERFIIGTLASMLWAAGIAALAKALFLA
jgi:hypothetical protein